MPVKFGDSPGDEQGALRKMGDAFQGQLKRGGQAGKNLERFQAAERLEASIVDPQGNIQPLNPGRVTEAYSNLNTLLGGSQSLGALEHFLPHTARGDLAKALEYVTGHPQDAGAQEFLKGALEIAKREKAVIGAQNARLFGQIAPTYAPTLKKYQSARNALKGYGITEDMLDPETFLPREVADPVKAGEQAVGPGNDKSPAQRKLRVHQLLGENPNLTDADIAKVLKGEGFNVR
jgi:hypothetical protein